MADTVSTHSITLDGARRVLEAALAHAGDLGRRFCIVITDPSGEAVLTARMDGAPRLSAGIAANKAFTVAGFGGMPTSRWWEAIKDEPSLVHGITHTPRLIVFGGGVGIFQDGELVGPIGVSGGSAEEDAEVAEAGAAVLAGSDLVEGDAEDAQEARRERALRRDVLGVLDPMPAAEVKERFGIEPRPDVHFPKFQFGTVWQLENGDYVTRPFSGWPDLETARERVPAKAPHGAVVAVVIDKHTAIGHRFQLGVVEPS